MEDVGVRWGQGGSSVLLKALSCFHPALSGFTATKLTPTPGLPAPAQIPWTLRARVTRCSRGILLGVNPSAQTRLAGESPVKAC